MKFLKFLKLENFSFIPKSACLIIILKFEAYCKLNTIYTFSWGFSEILPKYLVFKTSGEGQDSKCWSADYTSLGENMKKNLWGTKLKLTLSWWGGFPTRSFCPSASTRRAQLRVAAKVVRPTDLLNNVKYWFNTD